MKVRRLCPRCGVGADDLGRSNPYCKPCRREHDKARGSRRGTKRLTIAERLVRYSQRNTITGCFEWTKSLDKYGYGKVSAHSKMVLAHRLAYEAFVGPLNGMQVLHRCDNPRCINPEHLFLGTVADNARDMASKGRAYMKPGELNPMVKLTEKDVVEIRRLVKSGVSMLDAAKRLSTSFSTVRSIIERRTWRHLPELAGQEQAGER